MIASTVEATTLRNVQRFLAHYGIPGVVLDPSRPNTDPSRVFVIDTERRLLAHCFAHPTLWSRDSGKNHGKGVRGSFRSRTTPSMQVCIHEVRATPESHDLEYFAEIDFDEYSPAVNFLGHAGEVAWHKISGRRTESGVISRGLDRLLASCQQPISVDLLQWPRLL